MSTDIEEKVNYRSVLVEALQEMRKMRFELEALEQAKTEPIAIIGMDCRFPGGANTPDAYWRLLRDGIDAISSIPATRWDVGSYYDPDPDRPGKMYTGKGGFLDEVDKFDPLFFGISPLEAASMDPQQRLLLEVTYAALENAGQSIEKLKGSETGVFVGICFDDYSKLSINSGIPDRIEAYTSLGNSKSIAVGRLSYVLGLQGPNMAIDTSCSSSLLGIHLACQSLRNRESDLALAGGVNLILSPEVTIAFCKLKALSPDGRCKTFDAGANGYARGEGCGMVVLKRLSDAIANNDNILALIRGSAVNHDGQSNGLTAPNGLAQEAVISQALENAKVKPAQIQYVEAHGTGTSLGDPIEVLALGKVLGKERSKANPLFIGAVKTNFGHLEGAAGVASLMKVVLALQHKKIPPHLNFKEPNPYIPWDELPIAVPTELTAWSKEGQARLAGVSSFGMSGTNVHIVLEEALESRSFSNSRRLQLLVISAKTSSALELATTNLAEHLKQNPAINIADVAYTLQVGRHAFSHRRMLVCSELNDAVIALESLESKRVFTRFQESKNRPSIAFLFSGQGAQYVNMGLGLYQTEPVFQKSVDLCSQLLQPLIGLDLRKVLYPDVLSSDVTEQLQQTAISQPSLFMFEYALAKLWMEWGVHPQAMIGHSIGEYVAACLSGVFSLEDALLLVTARGQLMQQMPKGTMLAVALKEEQVRSRIDDWAKADNKLQEQLSIAAINGPSQCVVSGSTDTVKTLQNYLLEQGVTCRSLNTSHAFHSHMMEPILEAFTEQVQKINLKPPQIPYLSNVTGRWITADEATSPNYWARHLRYAVRFADGVQQLLKKPELILLEVGPGQTLSKLAKQQKETVDSLVLSSLPHPQGQKPVMNTATEAKQSLEFLLTTLGQLWLAGVQVDWNKFYAHEPRRRLSLPTYPFECQRYWADLPSTNNKKMGLFQDTQQFQQVTPLYSIPSNLQNTYMAPRHELERILVGILQENLGIAQIGIHDNFFELGGDSLLAIQIVSRLSQTFQVRLNQSQLIETPTVAKLASILQQTRTFSRKKSTLPLVEIQSGGSKRPLFCIHPAGGNVFCYLNLARYLDSEQPIYGLEDPNLYEEEKKINFQDKARQYIELIQTVQADGPYLLAGYSYGGNMAFEMAIQLKKQGHEVALLAMLDSFPPVSYENIFIDDTRLLAAIWQMTGLIFDKKQRSWYDELQKIDLDKQLEYVVEQVQMDESGIAVPESFLQTKLLQVAMNNFRELHNYVPQEIYSGQITYFWAQEKIPDSLNNLLNYQIPNDLLGDGWSKRTSKQIKNYYVPGHHFTMLNEPYLPVVAKRLRECLKQVETCVGS